MTGEVNLTLAGPVATIELDRPAKLNALTMSMLHAIEGAIRSLDPAQTRVLVIRGAGKVFSVGADLGEVGAHDPMEMTRTWLGVGHRVFEELARLPLPTIAGIHGLALGGGLELALACDLRVMAADAKIGLPEVGVGAVPAWGGITRVTQLAGPGRAADLILTRRRLVAAEAEAWGLVSRVAEPGTLDEAIAAVVRELDGGSPVAQLIAKRAIAAAAAGAPASLVEPLAGGLAQASEDLAEGVAAFAERRQPTFRGR